MTTVTKKVPQGTVTKRQGNVVWIDPRETCSCAVCVSDLAFIAPCMKTEKAA